MPVHELFSYRERMAKENETPVYVYDSLPMTLRNQVILIWRDALPSHHLGRESYAWKEIHDIVAREHGVLELEFAREPSAKAHFFDRESSYGTLAGITSYKLIRSNSSSISSR